ncbi:hypothetical protein ACFYSC_15885 [Streptosporangium sp. NPDC004379]|uniref:hypothetical protein n=1 Tax=Streptosporangium sp. NPDC004379 TaxID=3366189 RepID=UPI003675A5A3
MVLDERARIAEELDVIARRAAGGFDDQVSCLFFIVLLVQRDHEPCSRFRRA